MSALRGLFPDASATSEDLATREAAQQLFCRLLEAASSAEQYDALSGLLEATWQHGAAWPREAEEAAAAEAGGVPVSELSGSWAALYSRMLASGAAAGVLAQLDSARAAAAAADSGAGPARVSEHQQAELAAQAPSAACALCLRLLSAHEAQRAAAQQQLAGEGAGGVRASDPFAPQLLVLLLAQPGALAALLQAPAMEQLLQALQQLPLSPASCSGSAAEAAVVPALVSELLAAGKPGLAAAVVAQKARLHPSLNGFDGGLAVLQRFLHGCKDGSAGWARQAAGGALPCSGAALLQRLPGLLEGALAELAQLLRAPGRGSATNE